ncbi:hypothetical protein D3C81_1707480 [compost metagenome]
MLNNPGPIDNLPNALVCSDFANQTINIASPIVNPDPPIVTSASENVSVTICPPLAIVSAFPESIIAWLSSLLAIFMPDITPLTILFP